ncbi:hypothetical protein AVDCRST_MAG82-871, partial [uncultured Rubrobacteraceae bacterium]
ERRRRPAARPHPDLDGRWPSRKRPARSARRHAHLPLGPALRHPHEFPERRGPDPHRPVRVRRPSLHRRLLRHLLRSPALRGEQLGHRGRCGRRHRRRARGAAVPGHRLPLRPHLRHHRRRLYRRVPEAPTARRPARTGPRRGRLAPLLTGGRRRSSRLPRLGSRTRTAGIGERRDLHPRADLL